MGFFFIPVTMVTAEAAALSQDIAPYCDTISLHYFFKKICLIILVSRNSIKRSPPDGHS
jgi:hypothetical protein